MAIDFKLFNPEQLETVKALAEFIDNHPELSELVEFKGGYLPKQSYIGAVRRGKEGMLDIIPQTKTGALLARNVSVLIGMNVKRATEQGNAAEVETLRLTGTIAAKAMSDKDIADRYHDWYMACSNVPSDVSETTLGLLFVGEFIDATIRAVSGQVGELIQAMQQAKNATRH
ncbi:hypothetical protein NOX27_24810 [Enterobacter kobei]|uniref:hypothetical protein n=1 Tax=Enterobacter kobei TaxID=208224 RepID=UPI002108AAEB|nr:hypothetical protein [Enterobacter kobei]MCQ4359526.1 hypothetical protein [Enterobacter kobei]HDC4425518.1 hypothetical protein [Enterobacter kobei]HDC4630208.1 hypothetical protein [Enterobacter kobei]HDC4671440.1 hypothetical protein [Enterobacter kobei]